MTTSSAAAERLPPAEALWRAMGPTRLLDCGMDHADVLGLQRLTDDGVPWDEAAERLGARRLDLAAAAEVSGHPVTAVTHTRAAAACFLFAQMAFSFDVPRNMLFIRGSPPRWRLPVGWPTGRSSGSRFRSAAAAWSAG